MPLGSDGIPKGPWTPELLADAISQIDSNRVGVDLRTVQLWFQENEKGISDTNLQWLARIFGCGDHDAIIEWQMELREARSRFNEKRRVAKIAKDIAGVVPGTPETAGIPTANSVSITPIKLAWEDDLRWPDRVPGLALKSEALFSGGSPLNLPATVFAGVTALGFFSYITGIHSATYARADGVVKQVGFLWAPNWTVLFMVLLPLFFWFVTELLVFWKREGRLQLSINSDKKESDWQWSRNVEASSYSYWAVFLTCVLVAGVFQWIGVDLIPLIKGGADYATSWGTLAIVRPEKISVATSVVFTAAAYLYMSLCFYLFFAGLILLYTMVHDLWILGEASESRQDVELRALNELAQRMMRGIFRCTLLGLLVAICMKSQSAYLSSPRGNILAWFADDMSSTLRYYAEANNNFTYRMPTHYSSLLVAISACVVFIYGSVRLGGGSRLAVPLWIMSIVVAFLFASYLLIDAFAGFSFILAIGVLLGIYGVCDPWLGTSRTSKAGI